MAYKKRRTFKRRAARRPIRRKRVTKLAKPMRRAVQRMISRRVENKTAQQYVYDRIYSPVNAPDFEAQNIIPLGPDPTSVSIAQGVGQGQRIGNTIHTKKLVIRGTLVPLRYDVAANTAPTPVQIKIWIFYDKSDPSAIPSPVGGANFFQNGNASKGFQNDLTDLWSPVNTDRYRVLATRTFKLGNAAYEGLPDGLLSTEQNQFYTNNDFKYNANFSINLTKHYPKTVKFNDNNTTPTTRGLFMMTAYFLANGSAVNSGQRMVGVQYMQDYQYEDA